MHENPESPPRLLERAKSVGDLEQDPYVSHRSESRSSLTNRGCPEWLSTDGTARSWQELLRSIASKGEKVFAAGAQGAPKSGPSARFHRSEGVSRLPAANPSRLLRGRFCAYAVALIGVARLACRKPRKASRPRNNPAITIA